MRNIWRILRHDLIRSARNVMAIIVLAGLVVIPSLFTWFNVIASWDPFDNTQNLTVAVANTDEGYRSDLMPLRINIGEQALSALRANQDLNWVITSKEDAIDGTKSGEYYAALVLPPEFNTDMMTFYEEGVERTDIEYYTNEKKNALAPKITGQGASEVSTTINRVFTATLSEVGLQIISSLSESLNDADTQVALSRLEAHVGEVAAQLRSGADIANMFTSLISSSAPLVSSASDLVASSADALDDASDAVSGGIDAAGSLKSTLASATESLSNALSASVQSYEAVSDSMDDVYASLDEQSTTSTGAILAVAARVETQKDQYTSVRDNFVTNVGPLIPDIAQDAFDRVVSRFDDAIAKQQALQDHLEETAQRVTDGTSDTQAARQEGRGLIDDTRQAIEEAENAYDESLRPQLDGLAATLSSINRGMSAVGSDLSGTSAALSGGSDSLLDRLSQAESTSASISDSLTDAADSFDELSEALTEAIETGDLTPLTDVIGTNPEALATWLAEPVELKRIPVFSVLSFGSAMTPLYTVLALWVGALLLSVAIRVDVPANALSTTKPVTPAETYVGRYGIFGLIGFAQSTLVSLGLILFIQLEPAHPWLLILVAWVSSLVFTLITYTLVVAFGNAGKAISVLLLVVQISSSGGAYPLEVLPQWYQNISPFLPATHAVNAMRSAIAGVYNGDYWVSLGLLSLFVVPTLLLGFVLRRPLIHFDETLLRELESTKLM